MRRSSEMLMCVGVALTLGATPEARALPAIGASADVSAQWGSFPVVMDSATDPLVAQADAVRLDPLNNAPGTDPRDMSAGAWARASASAFPAPGEKSLHSASFVNEAGPLDDPPKAMEAVSTARVVTQWVVTTDGSFASTSAPVAATLGFDGYLFGVNGQNWLATVEATMNIYLDDVMSTVFQGGGQYARDTSLSNDRILTTSGGFLGEFQTSRHDGVPANGAWLDFNQSFDDLFVVNVGDVFLVELILQTRAQGLITSGEALANSNFYDSGNFLLSLGDLQGLTLTQIPVPEPGVSIMMAIGLGLMGWAGRRSKPQAAAH